MSGHRRTWVTVDLDAVAANVRYLAGLAAPAKVCAVVKANGYGHGALPVARAALGAGASMLGVALVEEAEELREAGISAPVLLLSQPPRGEEDAAVAAGVEVAVYTASCLEALDVASLRAGVTTPVHLKVNTGMNRVGCQPAETVALAKQIGESRALRHGGTWTHFAVADEPDSPATSVQAERFDRALADLGGAGVDPGIRHAANSAATLVDPVRYGYDMVRPGIAVYGIPPAPGLVRSENLEPALSLRSEVAHLHLLGKGDRISYGHRYELESPTWIATVPIGYHDGVRRGLSGRMEVLVGGRRRPVAGTITMDQIMVDLGDDPVPLGSEVVLIGRQGTERITAEDWAEILGTIGYEITCGLGERVPRRYVGGD